MVSVILLKIILCSIVSATNSISSFVTFFCARSEHTSGFFSPRWKSRVDYSNCFSIGLFLSVCFLGLYHSASNKIHKVQSSLHSNHLLSSYPVSEVLLCFGLFSLWLIELIVRSAVARFSSRFGVQSSAPADKFSLDTGYVPGENEDRFELLQDFVPRQGENQCSSTAGQNVTCRRQTQHPRGSFLKAIFLSFAMGFHSFLEGLGYGLMDSTHQVLTMAFAMALHQALCSATLGLRFARATVSSNKRKAILLLISYLLMLPFGAMVGSSIHSLQTLPLTTIDTSLANCSNSSIHQCPSTTSLPSVNTEPSTGALILMALLQSLAAATFLYVVFVEMLPAEINATMTCSTNAEFQEIQKPPGYRGFLCCAFAILGFLLIAGIRLIPHG